MKAALWFYVLLMAGAAAAANLIQKAPGWTAGIGNPLAANETAARAGAKLYTRHCSACHGRDGEGLGKAPPLNRSEIYDAAPGALFWVLRNGSLNRGMPSFAHLPEPQRWQIVTYLRTLKLRQ